MNVADLAAFAQNRNVVLAPDAVGPAAFRLFKQVPDLANGPADTFRYIYLTPGVANAFFWPNADFDAQVGDVLTNEQFRRSIAVEASVTAVKLADGGMAADMAHKIALVLALSRRVVRRAWGVAEADLVATQVRRTPANLFDANFVITADWDGAEVAALNLARQAVLDLYDADVDGVLGLVGKVAVGTPIVAGVILAATTNHHFVGEHKNVAKATLRQVFVGRAPTFADLTSDDFEDTLFHKVCHPIKSERLVGLARKREIKTKVTLIGLASAVVRVPAMFPPERAMSALQALVRQTSEIGVTYNVSIDAAAFEAAIAANQLPADVTPAVIVTAAEGVETIIARHGIHLAWCYGFMSAIDNDTPANLGRSTVLRSQAVLRVAREHGAAVAEGGNHYTIAKRWMRAQANAGKLPGVGLFGAQAPATRGDPDAGN